MPNFMAAFSRVPQMKSYQTMRPAWIVLYPGELRFRTIQTQSNRHDGSPGCPADAPAPNRIYGRRSSSITAERPRRFAPRGRSDNSPSSNAARNMKRPARRFDFDPRRADFGRNTHTVSIGIEPIRRPLGRRRKVKLVICRAGRSSKEGLEATVLPKLVNASWRRHWGQPQVVRVTGHGVMQHQSRVAFARNFDLDACHGLANRARMKSQRTAHTGVSRTGRSQ